MISHYEVETARELLRELLPVGSSVYGLRTTAAEGSRRVRILLAREGRVEDWSPVFATALQRACTSQGLQVRGGGTCPVLHIVQAVARAVHDDGEAWKAVKV